MFYFKLLYILFSCYVNSYYMLKSIFAFKHISERFKSILKIYFFNSIDKEIKLFFSHKSLNKMYHYETLISIINFNPFQRAISQPLIKQTLRFNSPNFGGQINEPNRIQLP